MQVIFLRHAQSEFNADPQSQTKDCPLSHAGRDQAKSISLGHFSLVIVSPLLRARQTLELSQITFDECVVEPLVREFKEDICDFFEDESTDNLETQDQLLERADLFINSLRTLSKTHQRILVVSHCELICSITGSSPRNAETVPLTI